MLNIRRSRDCLIFNMRIPYLERQFLYWCWTYFRTHKKHICFFNNFSTLGWHRQFKNGRLTRYAELQVAHAPRKPRTFSPPPTSKESAGYGSRNASRHVTCLLHGRIANLPVSTAHLIVWIQGINNCCMEWRMIYDCIMIAPTVSDVLPQLEMSLWRQGDFTIILSLQYHIPFW